MLTPKSTLTTSNNIKFLQLIHLVSNYIANNFSKSHKKNIL